VGLFLSSSLVYKVTQFIITSLLAARGPVPDKRECAKKKWRAFGAVGKLHNVVKYICGSPQRWEGYSIIRDKLQNEAGKKLNIPVMHNDTRWGSVIDMVGYALENRVHFDMYCRDIKELQEDRLIDQDWIDLDAVYYYNFNLTR